MSVGRFLKDLNADDILFGNIFDRPLPLPYGSGAAIQFMHMIDPVLEDDLYSQKPWALLVSTSSLLRHQASLNCYQIASRCYHAILLSQERRIFSLGDN